MCQQPVPPRRQLHGLRGQLHVHLPRGLQWDPLREQHARLHREASAARGDPGRRWSGGGQARGPGAGPVHPTGILLAISRCLSSRVVSAVSSKGVCPLASVRTRSPGGFS